MAITTTFGGLGFGTLGSGPVGWIGAKSIQSLHPASIPLNTRFGSPITGPIEYGAVSRTTLSLTLTATFSQTVKLTGYTVLPPIYLWARLLRPVPRPGRSFLTFQPVQLPTPGGQTQRKMTPRRIEKQMQQSSFDVRRPDGINGIDVEASLFWDPIERADAVSIERFFEAHADGLPFYYQFPSDAVIRTWKILGWRRTNASVTTDTLTATLRAVYDL